MIAEKTDVYEQQLQKELFTGQVEHLERKDVINMTVSQVLDSNINMEGDEFFAEVTDEVMGDSGVIIPKGTIAHGRISQTGDAKRLGRQAWISLDEDSSDLRVDVRCDWHEVGTPGDRRTTPQRRRHR